jgi:hypothetical protein
MTEMWSFTYRVHVGAGTLCGTSFVHTTETVHAPVYCCGPSHACA